MSRSRGRIVPYALAVVASTMAVLGLVFAELGWQQNGVEYYIGNQLSFALAFGWAGAILMRYPKARTLARLMLICAVADGCGMLAEGIANYAWPSDPVAAALIRLASAGGGASVAIALTVLPQAFPGGRMSVRPWPAIYRVTVALSVALPLAAAVTQFFDEYELPAEVAYFSLLSFITVGVGVGTVSLIVRWRKASAAERPQIRLYAFVNLLAPVLLLGTLLSSFITPNRSSDLFFILWPIAVVLVIVISVLRAQLYDIRIVIRRAAIYAALALLVALLFVAVYFLALLLISENLDRTEYRWVALAIAAAAVVLLEPVRHLLRDRLEQRLLGDRRDPLSALERFQRWTSSNDPDAVYTGVVEAVAAAVRSPGVALRLQRDGRIEQVASTGETRAEFDVVPLIHSGERLGELHVSHRTPGEAFSTADTRLLQRMGHEASVVVHAQRRDSELAGARRQAVDAVIDERSRLGRDLHDDLAPLLAGASLSLEGLRRGIPVGSPEEQEAARLATLLRHIATNTRRLAYDLQPPAFLADFEGAVAHHLETLAGPSRPCFGLTIEIDGVPPSLRHAAYRVVLEAVNNIVQHARAEHATISVTADDQALRIEVVDDGVGLQQPYISGIGISSMRRRVESVGGTFAIGPVRPHGTRVSASIPLDLQS